MMMRSSTMIGLCFLAPTLLVCGAGASPTEAPTFRVKTDAEIEMLAKCAESRASTDNDVYKQTDAVTRLQEIRSGGNTGYDFQAKLDAFEFDFGGILAGEIDTPENREFVQGYAWSLAYITVPSFLVLLAAFVFVIPCWCCKTLGEVSACMCCQGKGCCGICNDYVCGMHCCPNFGIFDGACRYGPTADYGTLGCIAHYERDPHVENMDAEDMSCVQKCGKKVELGDGEAYHDRDNYFGQRKKAMESRCSIPNFVFLIIMGVAAGGLYACGIGGQVYATQIINGITDVIEEGNCAVADAIDFVEGISKPVGNISDMATAVINDADATISSASSIGTQLTAIETQMTAFAAKLRADPCNFAGMGVTWPPSAVDTLANAVDSSAASVSAAATGPVQQLDATLQSIQTTLQVANASLGEVTTEASKITEGSIMDLLKDTISPINGYVSQYSGYVSKYQGVGVQVLFALIWGVATLIIIISVIWLLATELYECEQKKTMSKTGVNEAEGEEDDDIEKNHCCTDWLCGTFQLVMIWSMHLFHLVGWIMLILILIIATVFNPASIIMSDVCVAADHFAENPGQWLNFPGSPFANLSMVTDAVESCMDVNGNILDALGLTSNLKSFSNVSFGDATSLDLSALDFSSVGDMVTEVNAITTASIYNFSSTPGTPEETCTDAFVADIKVDANDLQTSVDALSSVMTSLKSVIGNTETAMAPISAEIDVIYAQGSCSFVRRRLNGILTGACGDTLDGMSGEGYWCLFLGVSLWVFLFVLHNFVITRFRMYDVFCWHHERTTGCCGPDADEDNDDEHIEMVNKYSGTRARVV